MSCFPRWPCFGWAGGRGAEFVEALPHFDRIEDVEALRLVPHPFGLRNNAKDPSSSRKYLTEALPCLFSPGRPLTSCLSPNGSRMGTYCPTGVRRKALQSWKRLTSGKPVGLCVSIFGINSAKKEFPEERKNPGCFSCSESDLLSRRSLPMLAFRPFPRQLSPALCYAADFRNLCL